MASQTPNQLYRYFVPPLRVENGSTNGTPNGTQSAHMSDAALRREEAKLNAALRADAPAPPPAPASTSPPAGARSMAAPSAMEGAPVALPERNDDVLNHELVMRVKFQEGPFGLGVKNEATSLNSSKQANGPIVVTSVAGQSESLGLRVGDAIIALNDKPLKVGMRHSEFKTKVQRLKRPLVMTVKRLVDLEEQHRREREAAEADAKKRIEASSKYMEFVFDASPMGLVSKTTPDGAMEIAVAQDNHIAKFKVTMDHELFFNGQLFTGSLTDLEGALQSTPRPFTLRVMRPKEDASGLSKEQELALAAHKALHGDPEPGPWWQDLVDTIMKTDAKGTSEGGGGGSGTPEGAGASATRQEILAEQQDVLGGLIKRLQSFRMESISRMDSFKPSDLDDNILPTSANGANGTQNKLSAIDEGAMDEEEDNLDTMTAMPGPLGPVVEAALATTAKPAILEERTTSDVIPRSCIVAEPQRPGQLWVEVYENQRYHAILEPEWGSTFPGHLLITDRAKFTDEGGNASVNAEASLEDLPPPQGFKWGQGSEWVVDDKHVHCDGEGWSYAFDMWLLSKMQAEGTAMASSENVCPVRRRRWVRQLNRENSLSTICHRVIPCDASEEYDALRNYLEGDGFDDMWAGVVLLIVNTRRAAEELAQSLKTDGWPAIAVTDMSSTRSDVGARIVVTTDLAMTVDKSPSLPHVQALIHFDLPPSFDMYVRRILHSGTSARVSMAFLTADDIALAEPLAMLLHQVQQPIPEVLRRLTAHLPEDRAPWKVL